jgi:hypothetical protein
MLAMQEQRELCSRAGAVGARLLEKVLLHIRRQQAPDPHDGFSQRSANCSEFARSEASFRIDAMAKSSFGAVKPTFTNRCGSSRGEAGADQDC